MKRISALLVLILLTLPVWAETIEERLDYIESYLSNNMRVLRLVIVNLTMQILNVLEMVREDMDVEFEVSMLRNILEVFDAPTLANE